MFNLWNFFYLTEDVCKFDVTQTNMPRIKNASEKWIEECLSTLKVKASAQQWDVKAFRGYYFSSYPNEADWRDRWTEGWTVKLRLDRKVFPVVNQFTCEPKYIGFEDETWRYGFKDPQHENTALFIASYQDTKKTFVKKSRTIIRKSRNIYPKLDESQICLRSFDSHQHQLRIVFDDIDYPNFIVALERLLELCKQQNGVVNWSELI